VNRVKTLALICARGGSKGIPSKNLQEVGGLPLVARAIKDAMNCSLVDYVLVSTDSAAIKDVAILAGGQVPYLRPDELSADDSAEWQVWQHALGWFEGHAGHLPQALLVVPPTSPLRAPSDLTTCLERLENTEADVVVSITPSKRNPFFNMVHEAEDGALRLVCEVKETVVNRQAAPGVFDMTTVAYACRPDFVLRANNIWDGRVEGVIVPAERALDIDDERDLALARLLLERRTRVGSDD
jgi:CMP-N-acetylneuraminic acid synthetase